MSEIYSWASPEVVSRMTLPQVMIYLKDDKSDGRPANVFRSKAERDAYVAHIRKEKGLV